MIDSLPNARTVPSAVVGVTEGQVQDVKHKLGPCRVGRSSGKVPEEVLLQLKWEEHRGICQNRNPNRGSPKGRGLEEERRSQPPSPFCLHSAGMMKAQQVFSPESLKLLVPAHARAGMPWE
jgi:hypothetical protein